MLSPGPTVRIFVMVDPVDMRAGHHSLSGFARQRGLDPLDGHIYVGLNKRRFMSALFWFDGSGWCVLKKRLTRGTFELPSIHDGDRSVQIDGACLVNLLQGVDLRAPRRRWFRKPPPTRP